MFTLVADETTQNLGIGVHQKRHYVFAHGLLRGHVWHDSTDREFSALVDPNYDHMIEIAECDLAEKLHREFDNARTRTIYMGAFQSLDTIDAALDALESWYKKILMRHGASRRFLIDDSDHYRLISHENAAATHYCDALIQARNVQAFDMMERGENLDHKTIVGRIMPIFLQALGLREYYVSHNLDPLGHNEVRFVIKDVGAFAFFEPLHKNDPVFMERYSCKEGEYYRNFSGPVNGEGLKNLVFAWMTDAARELETLPREDITTYLDELTLDVRRTWITKEAPTKHNLFADSVQDSVPEEPPSNVFHLGHYRLP